MIAIPLVGMAHILSYNNVTFRSGRIGIGETNPLCPLEIVEEGNLVI